MTLRDFLDAAYALLVRESVRVGNTLLEALEKCAEFAQQDLGAAGRAKEMAARAELRREEQAMKRLEAALARAGLGSIR
jgi:hypothetical protein